MKTTEGLPAATRRCWDCGVGSGPCQCTREYELWEAEREREDDALPDPLPRVRAEGDDE